MVKNLYISAANNVHTRELNCVCPNFFALPHEFESHNAVGVMFNSVIRVPDFLPAYSNTFPHAFSDLHYLRAIANRTVDTTPFPFESAR